MKKYDLIIVGGGASGLSAAVTAARKGIKQIAVIEKKEVPGKKIMASGNGRCNMTNLYAEGCSEILEFFASIGVLIRSEDEGRVYPYSEDAKDVVRALVKEAKKLGVEFITAAEVTDIKCLKSVSDVNWSMFEVTYRASSKEQRASATACLIACGGKAAPKLGTCGDGYRFAKSFGHSVSRLIPVLTAVELWQKPDELGLSGVRQKARVSLEFKGETLATESGEVQFTKTGLSGICIFNLSRYMLVPSGKTIKNGFDDYEIVIDFMPEYTKDEVKNLSAVRDESLCSIVKEPIARVIREKKLSSESPDIQLKAMRLKPSGARGWDFAQVTKGGVVLDEIDAKTGMSKLQDGLFFSGEIMDFDAKCGGYNLQHAWHTGIIAGEGIFEYVNR